MQKSDQRVFGGLLVALGAVLGCVVCLYSLLASIGAGLAAMITSDSGAGHGGAGADFLAALVCGATLLALGMWLRRQGREDAPVGLDR